MRIGHGYDVHRLVEGRKLILGGVEIPWEKGLDGHSDADVLTHAIMDALLGAAAPAVPVKDTIKVASGGAVVETPDRSRLFAVQTPQVFDVDLLRGALQNALEKQLPVTDDCSAVEAIGKIVFLTEGSEENIKITTPLDLELAEAILRRRREA